MAKAPPKSPAPSRVRFIMVEAEMADGNDLSQITQAIQNALRPAVGPVRLPASPRVNGAAATLAPSQDAVVEPEGQSQDEEVEEETEETVVRQSRTQGPRKPPRVTEVDFSSGVPFATFAAEKAPDSHAMRYLTVAAWFKLHRNMDSISSNHVYTCYRHVGWPTANIDWGQPLRDLKRDQYMVSGKRGQYEINQLGLQQVEKLPKT